MAEDWKPPTTRMSGGGIIFDDWQPIRKAIEAAYRELGRVMPPGGFPAEDWNLVGLAISAFEYTARPHCINCGERLQR